MSILITGGAGYIGSHVVKLLGERGVNIVTIDNLSSGHRKAVLFGKLIVGDIGDRELLRRVFEEYRPQAVIHFSAYLIVPESVREPLKYYRNNVISTINLLETMREFGIKRFIFSSSAAVYGIPERIPIDEDEPLNPINPYGETKATVERVLRDLSNADDQFKYASLRYFNVAGADPDCLIGESHNPETHLIPLLLKAAKENKKAYIYGTDYPTPDGTCIRDFVHVMDLAEAHVLALKYLLEGGESVVLNCGYGHGYSVREVVEAVKRVTGKDFPVEETSRREGDPPVLVAKAERIRTLLGFNPRYNDIEYIIRTAWNWELNRRF